MSEPQLSGTAPAAHDLEESAQPGGGSTSTPENASAAGDAPAGGAAPGNMAPGNTASGTTAPGTTASGNTTSGNTAEMAAVPDDGAAAPSRHLVAVPVADRRDGREAGALAPWSSRALATAIDVGVPVVTYVVASLVGSALRDAGNRPAVTAVLVGYLWVLAWVGWQVTAQARTGQTTGKRLARIRVVGAEGGPVAAPRSLGRLGLHLADLLPACLGFLWPLWDARRQTFADKLTGTVVVRT